MSDDVTPQAEPRSVFRCDSCLLATTSIDVAEAHEHARPGHETFENEEVADVGVDFVDAVTTALVRYLAARDARVRAAALAPIQALADEYREGGAFIGIPRPAVARRLDRLLAAAGVDAAPNDTTTEALARAWDEGVQAVGDQWADDAPLTNPYRAAVLSRHEQEGDSR